MSKMGQAVQGCFVTVVDGRAVERVLAEAELRELSKELPAGIYSGYFYDPEFDQDVDLQVHINSDGSAHADILGVRETISMF